MKCRVRRKKMVARETCRTITVRLDSEQENQLMDKLTQRIEWSTNRIVDEVKPRYIVSSSENKSDGFSLLIKCIIGIPILIFGAAIIFYLYQNAVGCWEQGFSMQFAVVMMGIWDLIVLFWGLKCSEKKIAIILLHFFLHLFRLWH